MISSLFSVAYSQNNCKVLKPEIDVRYSGACKQALATVAARHPESTSTLAGLEKAFQKGPVLIPGIQLKNMKVNGKKAR
jgi:hypothetical protein